MLRLAAALTLLSVLADGQIEHRRKSNFVCLNGTIQNGKCICERDFVGHHCEKAKHCATYRREPKTGNFRASENHTLQFPARDGHKRNSCSPCKENYNGDFCENIDCGEHGTIDTFENNRTGLTCECKKPYTGEFCTVLNPDDVYLYYNSRTFKMGPSGVLILLPFCACLFGCEYLARKRHLRRLESQLETQNVSVTTDALKHLLAEEV